MINPPNLIEGHVTVPIGSGIGLREGVGSVIRGGDMDRLQPACSWLALSGRRCPALPPAWG